MSLFGLFSDKHFPVYGQNLPFFPYYWEIRISDKLVCLIYNISNRYYINVRLQFLDLYISHSTNKKPITH